MMNLLGYLRCQTSEAENAKIEAWIRQSPDNEKEFLDVAKIFYAQKGTWDSAAAYKKVRNKIHKIAQRRVMRRRIAFSSAFVLLVAVANIAYWQLNPVGEDQIVVLNTNSEKVVEYTLPDGSTVWLNRNSSLSFPLRYARKERCVKLDGEGYFEVAKDESKPFRVKTAAGMDIKVLGTKFNLDAFAKDSIVRVSLIEGAVAAYFNEGKLQGKYIRLFPGDELSFDNSSKKYKLDSGCASDAAMWMKDTFIFNDTPLPEILRRLSHEFNADFIIESESLNANRYSGTFDNRELSLILDYISMTSGVKIVKNVREGRVQYSFFANNKTNNTLN